MRWHNTLSVLIFSIFCLVMVIVCTAAFARRSGSTGLDMAKIQELRKG